MIAANNMTMTNENSTLLCNETLDGSVLKASNKQPRALQTIQANEKKSSKQSKKKGANNKNKKNSLKALDDTLQDKGLCSCGLKSAGKCANNQCITCCSGCSHHEKSKRARANKRLKKANKDASNKKEETDVPVSKISQVKVVNTDAAADEPKVQVLTEKSVTFKVAHEETVEQDQEEEIVPMDIGGKPKDLLGSLIRAIASFPHFCPE